MCSIAYGFPMIITYFFSFENVDSKKNNHFKLAFAVTLQKGFSDAVVSVFSVYVKLKWYVNIVKYVTPYFPHEGWLERGWRELDGV